MLLSNGAPGLAGSYLVDMLHSATDFAVDEHLVGNDLQHISLAGTAELEPGDLLATSSSPLFRVSFRSILHDNGSVWAHNFRHHQLIVPIQLRPPWPVFLPRPPGQTSVHHLSKNPPRGRPGALTPTPTDRAPPPSLRDRLNIDQGDIFYKCDITVWSTFDKSLSMSTR